MAKQSKPQQEEQEKVRAELEFSTINYITAHPEELEKVDLKLFTPKSALILRAEKELYERGEEIANTSILTELHAIGESLHDGVIEIIVNLGSFAPVGEQTYRNNLAELEEIAIRRRIEGLLSGVSMGDYSTAEAIAEIKGFCEDIESGHSSEFEEYLKDDTDKLIESYKEVAQGIKTNIVLSGTGEEYRFTLPSGGLTYIGAPTGHGKSKMLQALALDSLATLKEGESILYITYEENRKNVVKQLLNAYVNIEITHKSAKHGNLETITDYLTEGKTTYMRGEEMGAFMDGYIEFFNLLRSQRLRVVKLKDNYLGTLLSFLSYANRHANIRCAFIDYIQELNIEGYGKYGTREQELKRISEELDILAQRLDKPIVLACQLNRQTDSPLNMTNQNIAESGWLERKASEILLLWSNKEKCKEDSTGSKNAQVEKELKELKIGTKGKLYALLTKSRYATSGLSAILTINGNTGRVQGNYEEGQSTGATRSTGLKRKPL